LRIVTEIDGAMSNQNNPRRAAGRTALLLGVIALAFFVGSIVWRYFTKT